MNKYSNLLILLFFLLACNSGPQQIKFGKDVCSFCKMTISDKRFGAELITKKGKIYFFDDPVCLKSFTDSKWVEENEVDNIYFVNFIGTHHLIPLKDASIVSNEEITGPMNGKWITFSNKDSAVLFLKSHNGTLENGNQLFK